MLELKLIYVSLSGHRKYQELIVLTSDTVRLGVLWCPNRPRRDGPHMENFYLKQCDNGMTRKHFSHYWSFVRGHRRIPITKGQ